LKKIQKFTTYLGALVANLCFAYKSVKKRATDYGSPFSIQVAEVE